MSYDNPDKIIYAMPSSAFGATTTSTKFIGPPGKVGWVRDMRAEVTADMVGTTTVPEINVGTAQGDFTYARYRLGTTAILGNTAAGTPYSAAQLAKSAQGNTGGIPRAVNDFAGHVALETIRIPADTAFFISLVAGVGGTPAGTARTEVEIHWF